MQLTPKVKYFVGEIFIQSAAWGRRCDRLLFMTTVADPQLDGVVVLNMTEGRDQLWSKTKAAFTYVYTHHLEEADWFLKADDDTYVVVENLRMMLGEHSSKQLIHFGHRFKVLGGFFSGGAGYVLSQAAVKRLVQVNILHPPMVDNHYEA